MVAYLKVGRIGEDQIAEWARRMVLDEADARRALASVV
jgi:5-methyltetrahydrofolate--homocysteine methyltransferase